MTQKQGQRQPINKQLNKHPQWVYTGSAVGISENKDKQGSLRRHFSRGMKAKADLSEARGCPR